MRARLSVAFLLLLIVFLFRASRQSSGAPPPFKWKEAAVSKSTDTLTSQAQKNPEGPEALLLQAKSLQSAGKDPEAQAAARKAMELAKAQGNQDVVGQVLAFIKLSGGQSAVRTAPSAPKVMLAENAAVLEDNPNINAAMKVLTGKSETGAKILKDDFGVQDPAKLQTLQQALGDKFIVRTDKTGRLHEEGAEITKGTGADAGKIILTFDTSTLDENQPKTLAPLVGEALRKGALTRDAEGKAFFSRVLTELDGRMHKIWIAVEVRDPGKAFEGTALGKALNYLIWVWEDDFKNKKSNSCSDCSDAARQQYTALRVNEQGFNMRGVSALREVVSQEYSGFDELARRQSEYQARTAEVTRALDRQDNVFRSAHTSHP